MILLFRSELSAIPDINSTVQYEAEGAGPPKFLPVRRSQTVASDDRNNDKDSPKLHPRRLLARV